MKILFWLEKRRANARGEAPFQLRITFHGKRLNVSTGIRLKEEQWDSHKQRMRGSSELSISVNELISTQRSKCISSVEKLLTGGKSFSTQDIAKFIKGEEKEEIGWIKMFDRQIEHMKTRIGVEYSKSTIIRNKSSRKNLLLFIQNVLKKEMYIYLWWIEK